MGKFLGVQKFWRSRLLGVKVIGRQTFQIFRGLTFLWWVKKFGSWWFLGFCGGSLWFFVALGGSSRVLGNFWLFLVAFSFFSCFFL